LKTTVATLDETDRKIIELLQEDGRMTHAALGQAVGLTAPSVFERVRKLEQRGIIKGYSAMIDGASVGRPLTAFIRLTTVDDERYDAGIQALREDPDILECYHVAGEDCFLIKTKVHDPGDLEEILRRVRSRITVQRSITMIAISTVKEHGPVLPSRLPEDD
jgi:Lrp/AsnC family leucine-responsive transcriptional regulator